MLLLCVRERNVGLTSALDIQYYRTQNVHTSLFVPLFLSLSFSLTPSYSMQTRSLSVHIWMYFVSFGVCNGFVSICADLSPTLFFVCSCQTLSSRRWKKKCCCVPRARATTNCCKNMHIYWHFVTTRKMRIVAYLVLACLYNGYCVGVVCALAHPPARRSTLYGKWHDFIFLFFVLILDFSMWCFNASNAEMPRIKRIYLYIIHFWTSNPPEKTPHSL